MTGAAGGLGRYLHERFGGYGLTRRTDERELRGFSAQGIDVLFHCAYDSSRVVEDSELHALLQGTVLLTDRMLSLSHRRFVFFSSVDVYPRDGLVHSEEEPISLGGLADLYPVTKLMCESMVRERGNNCLILRCGALLGQYARQNSLMRILNGADRLALSGSSTFSYVLYEDLLAFLERAIDRDWSGIFNIAARDSISLAEVAEYFGKRVAFGDVVYTTPRVRVDKVNALCDAFHRSSLEVVREFASRR